ncbi:glycosyltransferase family 61 protein [Pontibacter fetidus]|uniref:Glycosyltransferase family 61 protein n=1 Tax=Pontibacter fetidus TaxID=2700082 RepID=A0A6B2H8U6_9BACT|nr:glycosyltransferase family 61 protein [Pontibacter fetidus]NDK55862.1 glycosyltransferase family 61 protein [Pontibacter fetidus]
MKFNLKEIAGNARNQFKTTMLSVSGKVWRNPLTREETIALLKHAIVYQHQSPPVHIPELNDAVTGEMLQEEADFEFEPDTVWAIDRNTAVQTIKVSRSGVVLLNNRQLLNLDYGCSAGLLDSPIKTESVTYPLVVAPWSHFWGAYYDYIMYVVAKLCRIEQVYGPEIWQKAKVCYPLFQTAYEKEFLRKLNIPEETVLDTRTNWKQEIQADRVIAGNNQVEYIPTAADIALLRKRFLPDLEKPIKKRRLYIARAGRRKVTNEAELLPVLKAFGFEFIEDRARSVDEQIKLFRGAEAIVSPHGAALTNLLWCDPGTKVLELFNQGYRPNYYFYLCHVLHMPYNCLVDRTANKENHWSNTAEDIYISPEELRIKLTQLLP